MLAICHSRQIALRSPHEFRPALARADAGDETFSKEASRFPGPELVGFIEKQFFIRRGRRVTPDNLDSRDNVAFVS
jgi:hypothetical protein